MRHFISLGAGVQSSTLALMAAAGEITPMPECAIFSDTQSEPQEVYEWLDWLEKQLPFPVYRVTAGSLRAEILAATKGTKRMDARPPFYVRNAGSKQEGQLRRQCTQDYKIIPIQKKQRELLGLKPRARWPKEASLVQWIGISLDEVQRCKASPRPAVVHRWPLIEQGRDRQWCQRWLMARYGKLAPKSACTFCPYHDDAMWRDMKLNDPASFADAVNVDEAIRQGVIRGGKQISRAEWFLHRSCIPLVQIDFRNAEDAGQSRLFDEKGFAVECEGMCGV